MHDPSFQALLHKNAIAESDELTDILLIEILKWKKNKTGLNQDMIDLAITIALNKAKTILCPTTEHNQSQVEFDL
jgi:hypothetical protein